jgi:hypothetical protein
MIRKSGRNILVGYSGLNGKIFLNYVKTTGGNAVTETRKSEELVTGSAYTTLLT